MKTSIYFWVYALIVCIVTNFDANAQTSNLYLVGQWQNWNPSDARQFEYRDGMYRIMVDFSQYQEFKISKNRPDNSDNSKWATWDAGVVGVDSALQLNRWEYCSNSRSNIIAPKAEKLEIIVDLNSNIIVITDGGELSGPPDLPISWSGTLPLLVINTEDSKPVTSKDEYLSATYYLDPMGVAGVNAVGTAQSPLEMQIKGRGNYTWNDFEKKPYRLKLVEKQPLVGLKKNKHFALMAGADDDRGFLRNMLGYWFSSSIGMAWTPAQCPIELVINGEYRGLYFLTEVIRVDKDRVNIVEQSDDISDAEAITGGWLVEIDNYDSDPHVTVASHNGYNIWFTYKTPELLSVEQEKYLYDEMKSIDDLVFGDKNDDEIWNHIDIDDIAKFYIIQEITDNVESFHGSCYLYKDMGDNEKWHFGPVWDFGSSIGEQPKQDFVNYDRAFAQVWINELCKFPKFTDRVKEIWRSFCGAKFNNVYSGIDSFAEEIKYAAISDAERWPQYGNADINRKAAEVKEWISGSQRWLCRQWGDADDSGVSQTVPANLKIYASYGTLYIEAENNLSLPMSNIAGCYKMLDLHPGINKFECLPGFYIVDGKKVIVK